MTDYANDKTAGELDPVDGPLLATDIILLSRNGIKLIRCRVSDLALITALATYSNSTPMPVDVGGLPAGTTFDNQTMKQMFDALLYPYQLATFATFTVSEASPREVGNATATSVTFTWSTTAPQNVQDNSIVLRDVTGNAVLATGLADDGSEIVSLASINHSVPFSHLFEVSGTNTNSQGFSKLATIEWRYRAYWGASTNPTLTEAQLEALANNSLTNAIAKTYAMAAGGYKFICVAAGLGPGINSVKDQATGLNVPMADATDNAFYANTDSGGFKYGTVNTTNAHGVAVTYRVYRTKNQLGAAVNLVVT